MLAGRMPRSLGAILTAIALGVGLAHCGGNGRSSDDPALDVGSLRVGATVQSLREIYGSGTPAQWRDDRGDHVSVELFTNAGAVLAAVLRNGRVVGIEAFEHMTHANVHDEFALPDAAEPAPTRIAITSQTWLGAPIFSGALPAVPAGWSVPTDFTVPKSGKSFYVVREGHAASKTRSDAYGWIVHLR